MTAVPTATARTQELQDPAPKNQTTPQCRRVTQTEATGVSREEFPPGLHGGGVRAAALHPAGTVAAGGAEEGSSPQKQRVPCEHSPASPKTLGATWQGITSAQKRAKRGPRVGSRRGEGTRELSGTAPMSPCHPIPAPSRPGASKAPGNAVESSPPCPRGTPASSTRSVESKGRGGGEPTAGWGEKCASQITVSTKCPFLSRLDGYSIFSSNACLLKW